VFLVAFIISISRFFAKLHYPSDILAGAVIGVLVALIVSSIGQTMLIG
jgi:membrane-associated phospholipid phosphatase